MTKNSVKNLDRAQQRKNNEKERRRNEIVKSAEKFFISRGFDDTTIDDIALEAGFSHSTLYYYFNSKEDLFVIVVAKSFKTLNDIIEKNMRNLVTGIDKLFSIGHSYYDFSQIFPGNLKLINDLNSRASYAGVFDRIESGKTLNRNEEELKTEIERYKNYFLGTIEESILKKEIITDFPPIIISIVLSSITNGLINGLTPHIELLKTHGTNVKEVLTQIFELLYKGVKFSKY